MPCVICNNSNSDSKLFALQGDVTSCGHDVHENCFLEHFSEECPSPDCKQKIVQVARHSLGRYNGDFTRVVQDGDDQGIRFIAARFLQFPQKAKVLESYAKALQAALSPPLNMELVDNLISEPLLKKLNKINKHPDCVYFDDILKQAIGMIVQAPGPVTSLKATLRRIQRNRRLLFRHTTFCDPLFQTACERKSTAIIEFFLEKERIRPPALSPECVEREFLTACRQSNQELINLFLKSYSFSEEFLKKSQEAYPFLNPKTHETSHSSPTPAALPPPVPPLPYALSFPPLPPVHTFASLRNLPVLNEDFVAAELNAAVPPPFLNPKTHETSPPSPTPAALSSYVSSLSPPVSPLSPPPVMPLPYALSFPPLPPMHPFASLYNLPVLNEDFVAAELNAAVPPPPSFAEATHLPVLSEDLVAAVLDTYGEPRPKAAKPTIDQL